MKRSRAVRLTIAASASSAAAACAGPGAEPAEALHCVEDGTNRVVADSLCAAARVADRGRSGGVGTPAGGSSGDFGAPDSGVARGAVGHTGTASGGVHVPLFLWYYGGRVAGGYASAGRYEPSAGVRYRSGTGFAATGGGARRGFFSRAFGGGRGGAGEGAARGASAGRGAVSRGGFGSVGAAHGAGS